MDTHRAAGWAGGDATWPLSGPTFVFGTHLAPFPSHLYFTESGHVENRGKSCRADRQPKEGRKEGAIYEAICILGQPAHTEGPGRGKPPCLKMENEKETS